MLTHIHRIHTHTYTHTHTRIQTCSHTYIAYTHALSAPVHICYAHEIKYATLTPRVLDLTIAVN